MNKKLGRTHVWLITLVSFVLGLLVFIVPACKKEPSSSQSAHPEQPPQRPVRRPRPAKR